MKNRKAVSKTILNGKKTKITQKSQADARGRLLVQARCGANIHLKKGASQFVEEEMKTIQRGNVTIANRLSGRGKVRWKAG